MYPFSTKLKPQELAESFGPVATVNGFHHSAFADAVKGWSQSLYPFPLAMYNFKPLSQPQAILTIDFMQPLYAISMPSTMQVTEKGEFNCTVVWTELYIGESPFQDLANNWVSPYQQGKFVGYQKQLLAFQEEARAVEPGDVIQVEAALDNTLSFQFSAKWCVCWVMES